MDRCTLHNASECGKGHQRIELVGDSLRVTSGTDILMESRPRERVTLHHFPNTRLVGRRRASSPSAHLKTKATERQWIRLEQKKSNPLATTARDGRQYPTMTTR